MWDKLPPRVSIAIAKVIVMYRTPKIEHCQISLNSN